MSAEMPDDDTNEEPLPDELSPEAIAAAADATPKPSKLRLRLQQLARIHPWIALAAAMALAVWAWIIYPVEKTIPPPPAEFFYADALASIHSLLHPDLPLAREDAAATARAAATRLRGLFIYHGPLLAERPGFINPYLLLAESLRLRAQYESVGVDSLREQARAAYEAARGWEQRPWPLAHQLFYDAANHFRDIHESHPPGLPPALADRPENQRGDWPAGLPERFEQLRDEADRRATELVERRRRRFEYVDARLAEVLFDLGRSASARDRWLALWENDPARDAPDSPSGHIAADAAADMDDAVNAGSGAAASGPGALRREAWPTLAFECSAEERADWPLWIARSLDALARFDEAEPFYRLALRDRADATVVHQIQFRLGELAVARADALRREARNASASASSASSPSDPAASAGAASGPGSVPPAASNGLAQALTEAVEWYTRAAGQPVSRERVRLAHFRAGRAALQRAELLPDVAPNTWESLGEGLVRLREAVDDFAGRPPPPRARRFPAARARLAGEAGALWPDPFSGPLADLAARPLERAFDPAPTGHTLRRRWLETAAGHFRQAHQGRSDELAFEARFREGEALLAEGRLERARQRFTELALERVNDPPALFAVRLALARVDLAQGLWAAAERRILGGVERVATAAFLATDRQDDATDWNLIAREVGAADEDKPGVPRRIRRLLGPAGRDLVRLALAGRRFNAAQREEWVRELNRVLARRDFVDPEDFPGPLPESFPAHLRERPAALLTEEEVLWRNRLLVEAHWPYDLVPRGARDVAVVEPFPPADALPESELLNPGAVRDALEKLADGLARAARQSPDPVERRRRWLRLEPVLRFALDAYQGAATVFDYGLAEMYAGLADLHEEVGEQNAADDAWTASGRALLRVHDASPDAERAPGLLETAAGRFFRARRHVWAAESCRRHLDRHGGREDSASGGPGQMRDLLARCYWLLGRREEAIEAIRENIRLRQTPEGITALYYLGRLLQETVRDRDGQDRLGAVDDPLPPDDRQNGATIATALGAFASLRADPRLSPATLPWRWTTFALGPLWLDIARRDRDADADAAARENRDPDPRAALPALQQARFALREALDRYPVADALETPANAPASAADGNAAATPAAPGASAATDAGTPFYDYLLRAEALCLRFTTEFAYAQTLAWIARLENDDEAAAEARRLWEGLVHPLRYPTTLFDASIPSGDLYPEIVRAYARAAGRRPPGADFHPALGDRIGPWFHPRLLARQLRHAFHALGQGYRERAEAQAAAGDTPGANGYYELALRVYDTAYDRLSTTEAPFLLYQKAEINRRLGQRAEAEALYRQAITAARMQPSPTPDGLLPQPVEDWGGFAQSRLDDLLAGMP